MSLSVCRHLFSSPSVFDLPPAVSRPFLHLTFHFAFILVKSDLAVPTIFCPAITLVVPISYFLTLSFFYSLTLVPLLLLLLLLRVCGSAEEEQRKVKDLETKCVMLAKESLAYQMSSHPVRPNIFH